MTGRSTQQPLLERTEGRWLVSGVPGSGKTTLLRHRFVALVEGGADPERMIFLTATRRGARATRETLISRLGRSLADLPVHTVHGFAFGLVSGRFSDLGYPEEPKVLSAAEQQALVAELLAGEDPRRWPHFGGLLENRAFARDLAAFLARAQERLLDPAAVTDAASSAPQYGEIARFFEAYLATLSGRRRLDFGTLLHQATALMRRGLHPPFDHVIVDDYQEQTPAGEAIIATVSRVAASVALAGDPGGRIRRGPDPLERVAETAGPLEAVHLVDTFRLGGDTAALAAFSEEGGAAPAKAVSALAFTHPGEEAEGIAAEVLRLRVDEGLEWSDIGIVVRRHGAFAAALRHALARHGVPHVVPGDAAAITREPAVRPLLDLLRYVVRPDERDDRIEALLVSPAGGLTPHELRALKREARVARTTLRALTESGDRAPAAAKHFANLVARLERAAGEKAPDLLFFEDVWLQIPYLAELAAREDAESRRDLDALSAFGKMLGRFAEREPGEKIADYLGMLDATDRGADPWFLPDAGNENAVQIIAARHIQGMEWRIVLVANCVEGEFPTPYGVEPLVDLDRLLRPEPPAERRRARLDEERRLFRCVLSRARDRVILFASEGSTSRSPRTPSRYAERLGVAWTPVAAGDPDAPSALPGTSRAVEAVLRRTIADSARPAPHRLAALAALAHAGAAPHVWWGRRDWTDPGEPLFGESIRTSYSRLSSMDNCGLQYLYEVETGLDTEETHQMWLGSLIHGIIDDVHHGALPRDHGALVVALGERWNSDVFPNRAIEHQRYLDAKAMLALWLRSEESDPIESEAAFAFEIGPDVIRGKIDAVFGMQNGRTRVIDYKTSRSPIGEEEAKTDLQLAAYYLAVKRAPELDRTGDPGYLQLVYLGKTAFGKAIVRGFVPAQIPGYEDWAEDQVRTLLAHVRAEDFAPSADADCRWCKFRVLCPMWPEGAEVTT